MINLDESERLVERNINKGDISAAVKLLYEMIVQCAKEKKFLKAEELRESMLEADPMALDEIIRSAEIIEEEKSQALDPIHIEIWSRLIKYRLDFKSPCEKTGLLMPYAASFSEK